MRAILAILIIIVICSCSTLQKSLDSGIDWYSNKLLNDSVLFSEGTILTNDVEIMQKLAETECDNHILRIKKNMVFCSNSVDTCGGRIERGSGTSNSKLCIDKRNKTINYFINKDLVYSYNYISFKNKRQYILIIR